MAKNAASRQSTGSIPNTGAVALFNPAVSSLSINAAHWQSIALKGVPNGTFPHCPQSSWPHGVYVGLLVFAFFTIWTSSHHSDHFFLLHRESASYHEAKQAATTYQAAKRCLIGPNAPFAGWVVSGEEWESFDVHGELRKRSPPN
jgi:hypothetical protein